MLHHSFHYLWQKSRILLLEQVESDAEAFNKEMQLAARQLIVLLGHSSFTKLISGEHLAYKLLSGSSQWLFELFVEHGVRLSHCRSW